MQWSGHLVISHTERLIYVCVCAHIYICVHTHTHIPLAQHPNAAQGGLIIEVPRTHAMACR